MGADATQLEEVISSYYSFLESSVRKADFYNEMIRLVSLCPYFFAPYVEIVDYLESMSMPLEKQAFLAFGLRRVGELFSDKKNLSLSKQVWTKREVSDLQALLHKHKETLGFSISSAILSFHVANLNNVVRESPAQKYINLVLMEHFSDIRALRQEVEQNEACWIFDTSRQETALVQKETNTIVLRATPPERIQVVDYLAIDGPHESVRTPFASLFPSTIALVEDFAQKRGGGLGRIGIMRLKPNSRVYRHYDSGPCLVGRNRYHLVIQSKKGSIMTSGSERRIFHEGDLFFFSNQKMHTAENESDEWRIHVIFDMKEAHQGDMMPGDKKPL